MESWHNWWGNSYKRETRDLKFGDFEAIAYFIVVSWSDVDEGDTVLAQLI